MRIGDAFGYVGFRPRRRNCSEKMQYSSEEDAANAAREYNLRVVFADMGAYPCTRHEAWHIGHPDKHSGARQAMKAPVAFFMSLEIQYQLRSRSGNRLR